MGFSPALCTWYEPARLNPPCFAQPKLNGFRAVFKNGHFYSRSGNQWADKLLQHIITPLRLKCDTDIILDGELYRHGWTLDRIGEAISLFRRKPTSDTLEVAFYVFDLVADTAFADRFKAYRATIRRVCNHVQPVPAMPVRSREDADALHAWYMRAGFEGTIYRTGPGGYRPGRNRCLMKRKEKRGSGFTVEREFQPRIDRWSELP